MSTTTRSDIFTFWDTTLARGKYDFTLVDDRKRMLFDVSWQQWNETWKKSRGGVYDIQYDLTSPFDWTPPLFSFYSMVGNNLNDHTLNGDNTLTLGSAGSLVANSTDARVIRKNGYALKLTDNNASAPVGASSTSLAWKQSKGNGSITLLCQAYWPALHYDSGTARLNLMHITNGDNKLSISVLPYGVNDVTLAHLYCTWTRSGSSEETLGSGTIVLTTCLWYDVCVTYDANNNKVHGYFCLSNTGTSWSRSNDFLYGLTAITNGVTTASSPTFPVDVTWDSCYLLQANEADIFPQDYRHAYIQNAMIMDDFISPIQFNWFRRLFHFWNNKTEFYPA
jgi:hypothetical protein